MINQEISKKIDDPPNCLIEALVFYLVCQLTAKKIFVNPFLKIDTYFAYSPIPIYGYDSVSFLHSFKFFSHQSLILDKGFQHVFR
jgi:hypothetical protein